LKGFSLAPGRKRADFIESAGEPEIRANIERLAGATKQRLLPWSLPNLMRKNRLLLCLVPPMSHAGMDLAPRFDRPRSPHAGFVTSVLGELT
jgi:hypothetical protein